MEIDFEIDKKEKPCETNSLKSSTVLIIEIMSNEISVSPCEGKIPVVLHEDVFSEEFTHPFLFPTGKYGFRVERIIPLSASKYFNQRLLNYTQKFASDNDYLFFAQSVSQRLKIMSCINIAMRKLPANLTAGKLNDDYKNYYKIITK